MADKREVKDDLPEFVVDQDNEQHEVAAEQQEPEKPDSLHDVVGEMFLFMNSRHQQARPHETGEITKLMARLRALKEKA